MKHVDQLLLDFSQRNSVKKEDQISAEIIQFPSNMLEAPARSDLAKVYSAIEDSIKHIKFRQKQ